jgi:hypothetical protein
MTTAILAVEVRNSGRAPTSVLSIGLLYPNGAVLTNGYVLNSPELPYRIEGESEQTWYFDPGAAAHGAQTFEQEKPTGRPWAVRGRVTVGSKEKPVISKNDIRVLT